MPKTLLITGATGGIGYETSILAAKSGFNLVLSYLSNDTLAEQLLQVAEANDISAVAIRADVRDEDDICRMFDEAQSAMGQLTHLVNCAGVVGSKTDFERASLVEIDELFRVNVFGTMLCCREFAKLHEHSDMDRAIVNLSSRASQLGNPHERIHYAATKGAIDSFTYGLALELASIGVRVNAVRPGLIGTAIHAKGGDQDRLERLINTVPLHRIGTAQEVARTILFLLEEGSSYITGAIVDVSGGR